MDTGLQIQFQRAPLMRGACTMCRRGRSRALPRLRLGRGPTAPERTKWMHWCKRRQCNFVIDIGHLPDVNYIVAPTTTTRVHGGTGDHGGRAPMLFA